MLLRAYAAGFFPMAASRQDETLHWLAPEARGVLEPAAFHLPRRLARTLARRPFRLTANLATARVIRLCAASRPETWINAEIESLYTRLAEAGLVHSIEAWAPVEERAEEGAADKREGEGADKGEARAMSEPRLVGGLYGLALGGVFFGESMFSLASDASKAALVELALRLHAGGFTLLDAQFATPHLARFGFREIARDDYLARLAPALQTAAVFPANFTGREREQGMARLRAAARTRRIAERQD